ncbi:hypothetical protein KUW15_04005 [Qipengyuania aquimaris]|uniref:hypothetical protein n=1 Tax=Qipengyuania aquimaris TaxID=255984 RepID=UPI001C966F70|nr:hypothetical protein [Qipengyuania aquimaris]MBY6127874.1 hypothetical protein [Qipengyuania aquimaris]
MAGLKNKPRRNINEGWVKAADGGLCRVMLLNGSHTEDKKPYWLPQDEAWLAAREADPASSSSNLVRWRKEVAVTLAQLEAHDGKSRVLMERSEDDHTPVMVADLELRDGKLWLVKPHREGDIGKLLSGHGVPAPWA